MSVDAQEGRQPPAPDNKPSVKIDAAAEQASLVANGETPQSPGRIRQALAKIGNFLRGGSVPEAMENIAAKNIEPPAENPDTGSPAPGAEGGESLAVRLDEEKKPEFTASDAEKFLDFDKEVPAESRTRMLVTKLVDINCTPEARKILLEGGQQTVIRAKTEAEKQLGEMEIFDDTPQDTRDYYAQSRPHHEQILGEAQLFEDIKDNPDADEAIRSQARQDSGGDEKKYTEKYRALWKKQIDIRKGVPFKEQDAESAGGDSTSQTEDEKKAKLERQRGLVRHLEDSNPKSGNEKAILTSDQYKELAEEVGDMPLELQLRVLHVVGAPEGCKLTIKIPGEVDRSISLSNAFPENVFDGNPYKTLERALYHENKDGDMDAVYDKSALADALNDQLKIRAGLEPGEKTGQESPPAGQRVVDTRTEVPPLVRQVVEPVGQVDPATVSPEDPMAAERAKLGGYGYRGEQLEGILANQKREREENNAKSKDQAAAAPEPAAADATAAGEDHGLTPKTEPSPPSGAAEPSTEAPPALADSASAQPVEKLEQMLITDQRPESVKNPPEPTKENVPPIEANVPAVTGGEQQQPEQQAKLTREQALKDIKKGLDVLKDPKMKDALIAVIGQEAYDNFVNQAEKQTADQKLTSDNPNEVGGQEGQGGEAEDTKPVPDSEKIPKPTLEEIKDALRKLGVPEDKLDKIAQDLEDKTEENKEEEKEPTWLFVVLAMVGIAAEIAKETSDIAKGK